MIATCPQCQARYRLDEGRLTGGRGRLRCAKCGTVFVVATLPAPAPTAQEVAASAPTAQEVAAPPTTAQEAPAAPRPKGSEAAQRLLDASRGRASGLAVAVVGCEPGALREKIVSALARAGVRTLTTDDGPTCLDMARRTRPRLVVAASYLQGLTGPELAASLRIEPSLARTRILLLAAAGGDQAPSPGAVGVDAIAPASLVAEELELLLRELLAEKRPEARPNDEEDAALERSCRVLATELGLYHDALAAGGPALAEDLQAAREWTAERWPGREHTARLVLDAELDSVLRTTE